jgi:ferric-dicitrate binding protein FerR (iron transport regulator)
MTKSDDYLWDRSGPADPEVARLEELLAPLRHDPSATPLDEVRLARTKRSRARTIMLVSFATAAVAALIAVWQWPRGDDDQPVASACASGDGFQFTARGGTVACGGAAVAGGVLPVGGTLDTGTSEADLAIADIGRAQLGANTRVRLDRTSAQRHQLFLERGHLHARVSAPPRLFAVATPSADVTDLGCEYTLDIDPTGAGSIRVQSGRVELQTATGTVVEVPAGMRAHLLAGRRPSAPFVEGASAQLVAALEAYEHGAADGLDRVLAAASRSDALTIATLGTKLVAVGDKRKVFERLAQLATIPQHLTVDEVLEDPDFQEMWYGDVLADYKIEHAKH